MSLEINSLTIACLIQELKPLVRDAFVQKVQELSSNSLKLKLHSKTQGSFDLIISPEALFRTQFKIPAKKQAAGFSAFLKKHLYNKRIIGLEQHGFDRIAVIEFQDYYLVCEFFSTGNVILCDKNFQILQPFHRQEWKDRTLKKGFKFEFPKNISEEKALELKEKFSKLEKIEKLMEKVDEFLSEKIFESAEGKEEQLEQSKKNKALQVSLEQALKAKERLEKQALESRQKAELIFKNFAEIKELIQQISSARDKGILEKEIERKLFEAKSKSLQGAKLVQEASLKSKKIVLELE